MKILGCALLAGAVSAIGQTTGLPAPVRLELPPRVGITGEQTLSLNDVVRAVLENNRDLEVSRLDQRKAAQSLRAAKGYFDPIVGGTGYKFRNVMPVSSSLGGATNGKVTENDLYADPQVSGSSPWLGTTYKLDFASTRQESTSTFNTLNPTYLTSATLNITQPLWRGLLEDENRERIAVARRNIGQTQEQFRKLVIDLCTQAVRAYLELNYAERNLEVQIEAVNLAEQQDASNRRQVAEGTQAPIDVIQTQTQIATFQQNVFNAQQQLTRAENTLKGLMLASRQDALWDVALHAQPAVDAAPPVPALGEALRQAFASRPELAIGAIGIEVNTLDARLARDEARPQVNLTAQLGSQGLAGAVVTQTTDIFGDYFTPLFSRVDQLSALAGLPPLATTSAGTSSVPPIFVGGYGQSLENLRNGSFPVIKVGLQVAIPIRNRTAKAQVAIADATTQQSVVQQQQLEMTVEADVRNSLQQLLDARMLLTAAERARQLAEAQYASEQRQFKAGTSSVFLVLQRQNELIAAKLREIRAAADSGEAQAEMDRATANTLTRQHVDLGPTAKGHH